MDGCFYRALLSESTRLSVIDARKMMHNQGWGQFSVQFSSIQFSSILFKFTQIAMYGPGKAGPIQPGPFAWASLALI